VALFCGRFLQLMTWEAHVRTCRLCIAEAERLPGSSSAYLADHYDVDAEPLAEDLLARTVLPRLFRALLNVEDARKGDPGEDVLPEAVDLPAIRRLVSTALPS
jgi:hypothetical protein